MHIKKETSKDGGREGRMVNIFYCTLYLNRHPAANGPKKHIGGIGHGGGALLPKPSGVWAIGIQPNVRPRGEQLLLLAVCKLGEQ
jgi:hypothetical protein